jgi:hypothetical protein
MLQISSLPARLHMMQQETSPATGLRRPTLTMQGIASSQRSGYTYTYDGDGNRVKKATGSSGTLYWQGPVGDPIAEASKELFVTVHTPSSLSAAACAECGLSVGFCHPGCEELRDILLARDFEQPALFWQYHRLAVDTYCVQHSPYVESAKSLAAHLCGLCVYFEGQNDAVALHKLQRWLSTNPQISKPQLRSIRGALTIKHVSGLEDPVLYGSRGRMGPYCLGRLQ